MYTFPFISCHPGFRRGGLDTNSLQGSQALSRLSDWYKACTSLEQHKRVLTFSPSSSKGRKTYLYVSVSYCYITNHTVIYWLETTNIISYEAMGWLGNSAHLGWACSCIWGQEGSGRQLCWPRWGPITCWKVGCMQAGIGCLGPLFWVSSRLEWAFSHSRCYVPKDLVEAMRFPET